jgi:hypothetical protein
MPGEIGQDVMLIFLHIGKAGGTTFHSILERQYPASVHYVSHGSGEITAFRALPPAERGRIGVFRGHTNYGLHELAGKPCVYITLLRDPVERVISHYFFAKRDRAHPLHERIAADKLGLAEFLPLTTDNDNGQVRAFAGVGDIYGFLRDDVEPVPFGACDEALLARAKQNLAACLLAGLTERFDETVLLLRHLLSWEQPPFYSLKNVAPERLRRDEVPPETLRLIEQRNELDTELYRYATELFDRRISEQGEYFPEEVKYFRMLNPTAGLRP